MKIDQIAQLRKSNQAEQALQMALDWYKSRPDDPEASYQVACTYDFLGSESEAVPFYERALENGIKGESRRGAFLGLGSTYRCLGEYERSKEVLDRAIEEFPDDRSLKIFSALTLYNLGQQDKCVEAILTQLLDTTSDALIKSYDRALRFYSDKLEQTWK